MKYRIMFTVATVSVICATACFTGLIIAIAGRIAGDATGADVPIPYAYAWAILTTTAGTFVPTIMRKIMNPIIPLLAELNPED